MMTCQETAASFVRIDAGDWMTAEDYERLVPKLERALNEHGQRRALVVLHAFKGWTPSALWSQLKFDFRHRKDFDKVAVVGENLVQELATQLAHRLTRPFFSGQVRYFAHDALAEAEHWLELA